MTDSEFNTKSNTNGIAVSRVLELAALICLPVDLVTTKAPSGSAADLPDLIDKTGGKVFLTENSEQTVHTIVERVLEAAPPVQERVRVVIDDRPRLAILALAITALVCWGMIRSLRITPGW